MKVDKYILMHHLRIIASAAMYFDRGLDSSTLTYKEKKELVWLKINSLTDEIIEDILLDEKSKNK